MGKRADVLPRVRHNVNVTLTESGWTAEGASYANEWEDDRLIDNLCKRYGIDPEKFQRFSVDAVVRPNDGRFKGGYEFDAVPWIILTPQYEDVVDGVSMGQVYHAHELIEGHLGVVTLCWEGLIEHFGATEPGSLAVYLSNFARIPSTTFAIEADYDR